MMLMIMVMMVGWWIDNGNVSDDGVVGIDSVNVCLVMM